MTKDNFYVGEFILDGLEEAPRGIAEISITFSVDANGIVSVLAEDKKNSENQKKITITSNKGRLSKEKIDELVSEAREMELVDKIIREQKQLYFEIDDLCSNIIINLGNDNNMLEVNKKAIRDDVNKIVEWLGEKEFGERNKKEYTEVIVELKRKYGTLGLKATRDLDVKGKNTCADGTAVHGDDSDCDFEDIHEDAEIDGEAKKYRENLIELCNALFDVLRDDTINKKVRDELKDCIDDTLLWVYVGDKYTTKEYIMKIDDINSKCDKLTEDIFIEDSCRRELENLCLGLKGNINVDCPSDDCKEIIRSLNKVIDESIEWMIETSARIKRDQINGTTEFIEPPDDEYKKRIDKINEMCIEISRLNGTKTATKDKSEATSEGNSFAGTSILSL